MNLVCGLAALSLAALSGLACGDGDDSGTVPLADSGSLVALTTNDLSIPTTVAVRDGVAWVAESQFDRYAPFGGTGTPAPFRLLGIPLDGGNAEQIALPDNFFPEGVTAAPDGRLFVGSVDRGSIYTVAPDSTEAVRFLNAEALDNAVIGLTVSTDGSMLWACNSNPAATPATGAVVGIGIADAAIQVRHELRPAENGRGAFCNDLIMSPDGTLWITDSFGGRVFRILEENLLDDNSADEWLQDDDELAGPEPGTFGVNGITLLAGRLFLVNTVYGTLFSIDPSISDPSGEDIELITLEEGGDEIFLYNPDGITAVGDRELLVVENGLGAEVGQGRRLARVSIDAP